MQSYLLLPTLPSSFPFSSSNSTLLPFCPSHIYSGIFRNKFRPLSASAINGNINYYDLLGVSRNSSNTEVKRAYRLLARKVFLSIFLFVCLLLPWFSLLMIPPSDQTHLRPRRADPFGLVIEGLVR